MSKAKGRRYEHKAKRLLEAAGYTVARPGASLGVFDLWALGPVDIRLVQVKGGIRPYCRPLEREAMALAVAPPNASREIWKFYRGRRGGPIIEIVERMSVAGPAAAV